jgi:hypothetical protein
MDEIEQTEVAISTNADDQLRVTSYDLLSENLHSSLIGPTFL